MSGARRNLATVGCLGMLAVSQIAGQGVARAAAQVDHPTKVTIEYVEGHFVGKVSSDTGECEVARTVKIFKRTADGKSLVGKDKTDSDGRYDVDLMTAEGRHFARAGRTEPMADAVCVTGRSPTIRI